MSESIRLLVLELASFFVNKMKARMVVLFINHSRSENASNVLGYVKPCYDDRVLKITVNLPKGSYDLAAVKAVAAEITRFSNSHDFKGCGVMVNEVPVEYPQDSVHI